MTKLRKINRMDEFVIDEVSSVDRPAQAPARALIMKAADDAELLKRLRLTSVEDGHQHTVEKGEEGRTSYDNAKGAEYGHSHPVVMNDDGTTALGMAEGHTHTVIEKRLAVSEALSTLAGNQPESAESGGGPNGDNPMTKTAEEIAAEALAVEKRIEKLEGDLAKANALASLSDVQKAHYGTLSPDAQVEYLDASPDQRDAAVEKSMGDDPVVYTTLEGEEIRKSAGSLLLNLAKRADESEKNLAIEKAARERETFAKRAKEELSNLPGEESAQVALLKAVAGIPGDEDRKAAGEILAAANSGVSKAFETAGTVTGNEGGAKDAEAKLEKMANDHFAGNGGSFQKSYKAVLETPEGRELYKQTR